MSRRTDDYLDLMKIAALIFIGSAVVMVALWLWVLFFQLLQRLAR